MADEPRFAFHPLERRGLLLGLDAGQLLTIAAGALVAVVAYAVLGGGFGVFAGVVTATGGLAAALWTRDGSPLGARALTGLIWCLGRPARRLVDDSPRTGRLWSSVGRPHPDVDRRPRPTAPAGVELVSDPGLPGEAALGMVRDHRSGWWAAVVPVGGCSFSLMDPVAQAHQLEGWRQVLGALARPGSPVARVQWLQRTWTGLHDEETMLCHHAWVVLAVRPSHRQVAGSNGAVTELRREVRLLTGQLRDAALDPLEPLDRSQLEALVAGPRPLGPVSSGGGAWPLASSDGWASYRADGDWHATYWIAEWPRVDVGPDFLAPVLVSAQRTAVSVVMAPVPPDRAMREVRSARTADMADAHLKSRAGFLQSARRERESEGVARRETELADGHQEFRFSGYVTVSATDPEQLAAACAATEHSAQSSHLELRRLYGRQAEAYTWTLPLARGLR